MDGLQNQWLLDASNVSAIERGMCVADGQDGDSTAVSRAITWPNAGE